MTETFLGGVIEGFYGRPWTLVQRLELFDWMGEWNLNTYLYAPKDDLKLRAAWRELYDEGELRDLRKLVNRCDETGIAFVYAIAPGLDIRYADEDELQVLKEKVEQLLVAGVQHFCILFDDIPADLTQSEAARFGTFAGAQTYLSNELFSYLRERTKGLFLFCPTDYCGRMATPSVRQSDYLKEIGERLHPDIEIMWTGPEIVSETISTASILEVQKVLKRKPLIWDNLHANDYDIRRIYFGPYAGRPQALKGETRGILSNPNNEFEANFVPLRTLAEYVHNSTYQAQRAYKKALEAWLPRFKLRSDDTVRLEELELLGDLFYLFFEHGERAQAILQDVREMLVTPPERGNDTLGRLKNESQAVQHLFQKLVGLENRDLLYAVYSYIWEIEHELRYLTRYLDWVAHGSPGGHFGRPEQLTNTFRGGLAADIERLFPMNDEGGITL